MRVAFRIVLAMAAIVFAGQAVAQATFFEDEGFAGRSLNTTQQVPTFERYGFNNRASSVVIVGERWEVCRDAQFNGPCIVLGPGHYPTPAAMGLNDRIASARLVSGDARVAGDRHAPEEVAAQVTFYEREGFEGRSMTTSNPVRNLQNAGFNDRASSAVVVGDRYEVCDDDRFRGRCVVLRPGRYASLAAMGLSERVSSARAVAADARIAEDRHAPAPAVGQVTFFEREGFAGRSLATQEQLANLQGSGLDERAASAVVLGERWEVCDDTRFGGRCVVLRPGRYASPAAMGLYGRIASARAVASNERIADDRYAPAAVTGQVSLFEREGFAGRSFTTAESVANLQRAGFNESAASAVVLGDRYEVCDNAGFSGRCVVLGPGRYASLAAMGLNGPIWSVRALAWNARVDDDRYAPAPVPVYDSRRRGGERLYEANILSSRAVLATSGQRCWVESERVSQDRGGANVQGAIVGAILGGILGHQVGGGSGQDVATVGGAVAGAAVGAQVGRGGDKVAQDVERCENVPGGAQPAYWDVVYNFRGQEHRVQLASAPGRTIVVNERGEPRQ